MAKPQPYIFITMLSMAFFTVKSRAQEKFTGFFQPSIELSYKVTPKYTHSFGIENRNVIYKHGEMDYLVKKIDLIHFSEFQIHTQYAFGLGLLYRLEQTFDVDKNNEFRLQEQFIYTPVNSNYNTKHRFRAEQRFYPSETKHRFRYQLSYTFPLAEENATKPYLKAGTESLLEVAKSQKPEFEQRLGLNIGWSLNAKTKFEVGTEYQLADYTQDLNHELFLLVALEITL